MKANYNFDEELCILECSTYAVRNTKSKENKEERELKRLIGKDDEEEDDEELVGEPKNVTLDFEELGGILYFHDAEADLHEIDNGVSVTFIEFSIGLTFMLLIPYKEFNEIFKKYKRVVLLKEQNKIK